MNSREIYLVVVLTVLFTSVGFAQKRSPKGGGQQERPKMEIPSAKEINEMVNELSKDILLSAEQSEKVKELYTTHFAAVEQKMKNGRPDRKEMQSLKEEFESDINSILSKDQQKLFEKFHKEQKDNRKKH